MIKDNETRSDTLAFKVIDQNLRMNKNSFSRLGNSNKFQNKIKCFNFKKGHIAKYCKEVVKFCSICKKNKQIEKDCHFRHKSSSDKQTLKPLSFSTFDNCDRSNTITEFIVVSGSTFHKINDKNMLKYAEIVNKEIGEAKTTQFIIAEYKGTAKTNECIFKKMFCL